MVPEDRNTSQVRTKSNERHTIKEQLERLLFFDAYLGHKNTFFKITGYIRSIYRVVWDAILPR